MDQPSASEFSFVYHIPTKVYFGPGQLRHLGEELAQYGKRVLLCYGGGSIKKTGLYDRVVEQVKAAGLEVFELGGIDPNPKVSSVNEGGRLCREHGVDVVLAVGGGSVIDCAKFVAAAAFYEGDAWDITLRKVPVEQCLPIVAVLTLAATGSEMDAIGVISNPATNDKIGRSFPQMRPRASFLDPTETYSVSAYQTACGSADILSHVMETYFVPRDETMYLLDGVMESIMRTVVRYAPAALAKPDDYEARANLMWASSWGINGFIGGLQKCAWINHAIEHQLSAFYDITHGLGLAIVTPRWMRHVLDEDTAWRFYDFGVNVFGIDASLPPTEAGRKAIEATEEFLFDKLGLTSHLADLGIDETHFEEMAEKVCKGGTFNGFTPMVKDDVLAILRASL